MDIFRIKGGKKLVGEVNISGAKNAALPIIVASLLTNGETVLKNVPNLVDVRTMCKVIRYIGAESEYDTESKTLKIKIKSIKNTKIPYDLVKTMRASIYVMGPMLARIGEVDVSLPGGCAIGPRPIDIHLEGFESMGAKIKIEHGYINARTKKLKANKIIMKKVSVGATANLIMASVLSNGETILENCAMEPDITDLANFLIQMGADIQGMGTEVIRIRGVKELKPVTYSIMPDRIEAGTYLLAGAITRGTVKINNMIPDHIGILIKDLTEMGFNITQGDDWVKIEPSRKLQGAIVKTQPYPGFPTDLQAPMMALMCTVPGVSVIVETIFDRYNHVAELARMGADITLEGDVAIIKGIKKLTSATVMMSDLRAGAALVIAALAAENTSEIRRIYHSDRGYENLSEKLSGLGADIIREKGGKS